VEATGVSEEKKKKGSEDDGREMARGKEIANGSKLNGAPSYFTTGADWVSMISPVARGSQMSGNRKWNHVSRRQYVITGLKKKIITRSGTLERGEGADRRDLIDVKNKAESQ